MTITRADVADLREGDVVELTAMDWSPGSAIRGPLVLQPDHESLVIRTPYDSGTFWVRTKSGDPYDAENRTLTVISRAMPPLYTNSDKTEPDPGDVVRDCDGDAWQFTVDEWWCASPNAACDHDPHGLPIEDFVPLTLLWDGRTGLVLP